MDVVVLGAGVIGITTAYYLSEKGYRVTVVDSADELASGASGGNGGQLSYSFSDAMASPALLAKTPRLVMGLDPAFCIRPPINPHLVRWGLSFLAQCTTSKNHRNTTEILKLALESSRLMEQIRTAVPLDFAFRQSGKLVMLTTPAARNEAEEICRLKRQHGCSVDVVSLERAVELEPAIRYMKNTYLGAVYSEHDEVGNSQEFTVGLGKWLAENRGVKFKLNTRVNRIVTQDSRLQAVETDQGRLEPDALVVCMGSWSHQILKPLGIRTNIYPMRGYSLTLPAKQNSNFISITDPGSKMVFSRLGDQIRIAGFADFVGFSTAKDNERIQTMLETARKIAPEIADYDVDCIHGWGGFRPLTPDSRPLTGPSKISGLHLNTGHGMLGWTLALATSHAVASGI